MPLEGGAGRGHLEGPLRGGDQTGEVVEDEGRRQAGGEQEQQQAELQTVQELFDDEQFANMLMVGAAYQTGALPISAESIERAIELNGVAVEKNLQAFRRSRQSVSDPAGVKAAIEALGPTFIKFGQVLASRPDLMAEYVRMGARYVSTGTDLAFLLGAATARAKQIKDIKL